MRSLADLRVVAVATGLGLLIAFLGGFWAGHTMTHGEKYAVTMDNRGRLLRYNRNTGEAWIYMWTSDTPRQISFGTPSAPRNRQEYLRKEVIRPEEEAK